MFKNKKLKCSVCKLDIKANERIVVELIMPSSFAMPYGSLDAALQKQANKIICSTCKNQDY